MSNADLLADVFGRTTGDVTLFDGENAVSHTSFDDLAKAGAAADKMTDPWVDLVTSDGQAIGRYVAGKASVLRPEPSVVLDDGAVYMFDGDPLDGQEQGVHICRLSALSKPDDLIWYPAAELQVKTPASDFPITLMRGRRRDEGQGKWKEQNSTYGQFSDFLQQHTEGPKDGPCFQQGQSIGGARKSTATAKNYVLGIDLDSGAPLEDVTSTIRQHGLEAVIYTTHSHMKDMSTIKKDDYFKKTGEIEPTEDGARAYLMQIKGVLPHILEECQIVDAAKHTVDGVVIEIRHKPMPKYRVVHPLHEPFVFAARGGTQQDAIMEWRERYAGFCTELGLFFDEKCVDPARLFYYPRHPKGDHRYGSWHIAGLPLNLDDYDRVKIRRGRDGKKLLAGGGPKNAFTEAAGGLDEDNDFDRYRTEGGYDLIAWSKKYAKRFEVEAMLDEVVGGDFMRDARTGGKPGTHIECPFEAEHTSLGGGGTYVVNASDNYDDGFDGGFSIHCVHNACSGRKRLDYLKKMIDDELITTNDIQCPDYLIEAEDDETRLESVAANVTPTTQSSTKNDKFAVKSDFRFEDDDEIGVVDYFNKRYAIVEEAQGRKILKVPGRPGEPVTYLSEAEFHLLERPKFKMVGSETNKRRIQWSRVWLDSENRRTYRLAGFHPGYNDPSYYNLFRGWTCEQVEGECGLIIRHIREIICSDRPPVYDFFMTYLAHMVQCPGEKPGIAIVVKGQKGTGKSIIFDELLYRITSPYCSKYSSSQHLESNFNQELEQTICLVCEEAITATDRNGEARLKDMVTGGRIRIEGKGRDSKQVASFLRMFLISNHDHVVPASWDERRFLVLDVSDRERGNREYFKALHKQIDSVEGQQAFMHMLATYVPEQGWDILRTPPRTRGLDQQIKASLRGAERFMLYLAENGSHECEDLTPGGIFLGEHTPTEVSCIDMRRAMLDFFHDSHPTEKQQCSVPFIEKAAGEWLNAVIVKRAPTGMNKTKHLVIPPLKEIRQHLAHTKRLEIATSEHPEIDDEADNVFSIKGAARR